MDEKIDKIWFTDGEICLSTKSGRQFSQPLEAFPALFLATPEERENYYVWADNSSIRWEKLDEDIHISNFYEKEKVNYDNEINLLLSRFPWIDMKAFAEYLDMHWTKLARFRYGIWTPTPETVRKIKDAIRTLSVEMKLAVS